MSRYEHGRILAVNINILGSELTGDHTSGVTTLTVEDAADFDESGGTLVINGQVISYTAVDDEAGTITLAEATTALGEDGDRVYLYDPLYLTTTTEKIAQVRVDGEDDNTDPVEAAIAQHLVDQLDEGVRGATGESVKLEFDSDEWTVVDVYGLAEVGSGNGDSYGALHFRNLDSYDLTVAGAQSVALTYEPVDGSEHVYWNGLQQRRATDWTRAGQTVSVLVSDLDVGDVLDVEYAYLTGTGTGSPDIEEAPLTSACANGTPQSAWGEEFYTEKPFPGGAGHRYRIRVAFADRDPAAVWLVGLVYNNAGAITVHAVDTGPGLYKAWVGDEFTYSPSADSSDGHQVNDGAPGGHGTLVGVHIKPYSIGGMDTVEVGYTDPSVCKFFIGEKFRDVAGDTDEPWTELSDS